MAGLKSNGFDTLEFTRQHSIKKGDIPQGGSTVFQLFVPASPLRQPLPPNLPPLLWQRDRVLSMTPRADAQWGSAIGIAVTKVASLAWEVKSEVALRSKKAQDLCLNADSALGQGGWVHYIAKQVRDYLCTNNGCVTEIVRETMAYGSRIVGINHLPSIRCRRTGVPEKPIIYIDKKGQEHLLQWWQVMYFCDLPDPDEDLYGGGLCAAERAYPQIIKMSAIETFIYEKVSAARPLAIHVLSGLRTDQIDDAIKSAEDQMAREGLTSYMGAVIMATINPTSPPAVVTIPLAELPNGFEAVEERNRADLIYSNSIGLDPQDLAPLATSQLGTATQSLVLHDKAKGRGLMMFKQAFVHAVNQLILDDQTKFIFTERDYDDQKKQADVSKSRADVAKSRIDAQITTPDQELQLMVDLDELPKAFISEDLTPGDILSDTDKETKKLGGAEAETTGEEPSTEGGPTEESSGEASQPEAPVEEPPYLLKSKSRRPIRFDEDPGILKLVDEMMFELYGTSRMKGNSNLFGTVVQRCVRCKARRRDLTLKACHHCGLNFHKEGGGGGSGFGTHTKFGVKLTPKLAKEILANPEGHDPDTIKSAAKHLHDKGYIGHGQYQKELQKASKPTSLPSKSGPSEISSSTPGKFYSTDEAAVSALHGQYTQNQHKLQAAEQILNSPTTDKTQKAGALNHLYDEGFLTTAQYGKLVDAVDDGKSIGNIKVSPEGGFTVIGGPSTPSASSIGKLSTTFADTGHAYNSLMASQTTPGYKKEAAEHLIADPKATQSQKQAAVNYLASQGHISPEQAKVEFQKAQAHTPQGVKPSQIVGGEVAAGVLKDSNSTADVKQYAAEYLYKNGVLSKEDYNAVNDAVKLYHKGIITDNEFKQEMDLVFNKAPGTSTPPVGSTIATPHNKPVFSTPGQADKVLSNPQSSTLEKVQAAEHLYNMGLISSAELDTHIQAHQASQTPKPPAPSKPFVPVSKPSEANKVLASSTATTEAKLQAAQLLHEKGYSSKKTYELQKAQIVQGGQSTPQQAQQSALNAAHAKIEAHNNPSNVQAQQQAQTAQAHANNVVKGGIAAHQEVPGDAKQWVGAQGSSSASQASSWGTGHYNSTLQGLPSDQKSALSSYTGGAYDSINSHLRSGGKPTSSDLLRDQALRRGKTPETILVHRGFDHESFRKALESGSVAPGTIIHDKGYVSTSLHSERAFTNKIRMRAVVPKGSPGLYVESISHHPHELEFLMPRNSSFVIKGYQKIETLSGSYYWLVDAEYVGSGEVYGA